MWILGLVFLALGTVTVFAFDAEAAAATVDLSRTRCGSPNDRLVTLRLRGGDLCFDRAARGLGPSLASPGPGADLQRWYRSICVGPASRHRHRHPLLPASAHHRYLTDRARRAIYDASVEFYAQPVLLPMEILLVGAVVYHTLNGIRIMTIDFTKTGYRQERVSFAIVMILTILLTLPSAWLIFRAEL